MSLGGLRGGWKTPVTGGCRRVELLPAQLSVGETDRGKAAVRGVAGGVELPAAPATGPGSGLRVRYWRAHACAELSEAGSKRRTIHSATATENRRMRRVIGRSYWLSAGTGEDLKGTRKKLLGCQGVLPWAMLVSGPKGSGSVPAICRYAISR